MAEKHVFSTGKLRVGPPGSSSLSSSNLIGVIQDITIDSSIDRVDLFDAPVNSVYAVDTADHEAHIKAKFTGNDLNLALMAYTVGATVASGVATIGKTSKPQPCRVEIEVTDNQTGAISVYAATNAKFKGQSVSMKQKGFSDLALEADFYPDSSTGTVMTRTDS